MASLPELAAAWVAAGPHRGSTAPLLAALNKAAAGGKENGGKAQRDAAQQCFKACQAALGAPGASSDAVAAAAAVGRAALAALAATSPPSAAAQLAGWRYNFARRLVACKAFAEAHAEAVLLFAVLRDQPSGGGEAASLAVGAALTLVLSCVEGKLLGDVAAVMGLVDAARALPRWLSQLPAEEAGRHSEAAFKYLYKAAVTLLERQAWQQLDAVCGAMLAAAGSDAAAQRRAAAAVGKLVGHAPEERAAAVLAAVAEAAAASEAQLSSAVALDLLGLLCSAAQRAESADTCQQLWQAAEICAASQHQLLQTAGLLLPALAMGAGSSAGGGWPYSVTTVVNRLVGSITQLEGQQGPAAQAQLSLLDAAFLPANVVRRVVASQLGSRGDAGSGGGGSVVHALGGAAAASAAAEVLELLAGAVGAASRHAPDSSLAGQGHAAAVALATAARLRAAAGGDQLHMLQPAARSLLGWDLQSYSAGSSELPSCNAPVEQHELGWLASALFNVGVDLHGSEQYAAAAAAMHASLAPAVASLHGLADAGSSNEVLEGRAADFCRKCIALSDAQQRAGDCSGALSSLGHSTALMMQLGFDDPAAWRPLVHAFVRLQAEQPPAAEAATAATQPARRGRGTASKKAAPAAGPTSSGGGGGSNILLVDCLLPHAEHLPEGSLAAVVEQELQCWSCQQGGSSRAGQLATRLLQDTFPASQQPVQHAGLLLALHQLGLPADYGSSGLDLLERAAVVLDKASCPSAAGMLARVRCAQALGAARGLAQQALLEQQQERQRSHAAASTSAASSVDQDAAAVGQLADARQADAAAWQQVGLQAQQAVAALMAARRQGVIDSQTQEAFQELAWLLSLQGAEAAAEQLHAVLPAGPGSETGDALAAVFPGTPGAPFELEQAAADAAAEGGRSGPAVLQRAALHGSAAEAHAAAGDMVPALFHASEAHRLLAVLFHAEDCNSGSSGSSGSSSSSSSSSSSAAVGWWRLTGAYLGSLLQLGQLFEAAGLADEALHALREAQRLAVAAGAAPLAALCAARLADIYCRQGQLPAAQQAVVGAEQQLAALEAPAGSASLAQQYCQAAVLVARAQLDSSSGKGGTKACQAAVTSCRELVAAATKAGGQPAAWCSALLAAALLQMAEAAMQAGNQPAALQDAADALAAAAGAATPCSAGRHMQAAALVFLGQHAVPVADAEQHLAVWGLGQPSSSSSSAAAAAPAAKGRARKAPARQPASRGRNKTAAAAIAAAADDEPASSSATALQQQHLQHLWRALDLSRGQLSVHRAVAAALAEACGHHGYLHLAAWLLQSSLGAAMRLQYQLVLHSRRQQLAQRARRGLLGEADAQPELLEQVSAVLDLGLDWQLVGCLAGSSSETATAAAPARGRKGGAAKAAAASASGDPVAALAALEGQAAEQLRSWQAVLPAGTAACSVSVLPSSGGSSLLICRLPAAKGGAGTAALPPLLVAMPVQQLSASLSQHPIRALQLDEDAGPGEAVSSVQSVLDEMAGVLADSGRSMREMATDTKEQQREWWRARLALEDRLAALVRHLDSSWLGPWRCLLLGERLQSGSQAGDALARRLLELLDAAGQPASPQQAGVLRHAAAVLACHAGRAASSGEAGMSPSELRQAVHQLCSAAGLACSQEQQHELEALLSAPLERAAAAAVAAAADVGNTAAAPSKASKSRRAGGKSVKFADDVEDEQQKQPEPPATAARAASKGRRRGAAAAAAAAEQAAETSCGGGDTSPVATLGSLDGGAAEEAPQTVAQSGLCQVFDSLNLEDAPAGTAAAAAPGTSAKATGATTARGGKHRSRLRMMQAGTPGPATARRSAAAAAATAPRPARDLPLTVAKSAPPAAARPGSGDADVASAAEAAAPVLLVLDGGLQALPWESAPGLLRQRLYRMPSLACAAASAHRASTSVDLSSTFYALNPSGDLADTQSAFQDWFSGMHGWQGKAGCAPTAAELAEALTSRQLFLYCGHGGGEQYISAAKLRSLERCSAALLMGCSSGRLRAQRAYEPSGAVLAYLLAGCPAAVANLWDVTDRDIDRFSQAVLTAWISGAGSSRGECSSGGGSSTAGTDVCAAVAASRTACKLPHLVGAAPVCYGIPSRIVASEG